jgi:hypothetical protein
MPRQWIQKAIKKPGSLTRQAAARGQTVAGMIEKPPKGASKTTKQRLALAKTLRKLARRRRGKPAY